MNKVTYYSTCLLLLGTIYTFQPMQAKVGISEFENYSATVLSKIDKAPSKEMALKFFGDALLQESKVYKEDPNLHLQFMSRLLKRQIRIYESTNQLQKEEESFKKLGVVMRNLVEVNPTLKMEQVLYTINLGNFYNGNERTDEALSAYANAIELLSSMPESENKSYYDSMARLYYASNLIKQHENFDEASNLFNEVLSTCQQKEYQDLERFCSLKIQALRRLAHLFTYYLPNEEKAYTMLSDALSSSKEAYNRYRTVEHAAELCEVWYKYEVFCSNRMRQDTKELASNYDQILKIAETYSEHPTCKMVIEKIKGNI